MLVDVLAVVLAIFYGTIDEFRILGLFRGGEDERWVGSRILRLVLVDSGKVTGVADDGLFARTQWLAFSFFR